jgi:hypothetical protein
MVTYEANLIIALLIMHSWHCPENKRYDDT